MWLDIVALVWISLIPWAILLILVCFLVIYSSKKLLLVPGRGTDILIGSLLLSRLGHCFIVIILCVFVIADWVWIPLTCDLQFLVWMTFCAVDILTTSCLMLAGVIRLESSCSSSITNSFALFFVCIIWMLSLAIGSLPFFVTIMADIFAKIEDNICLFLPKTEDYDLQGHIALGLGIFTLLAILLVVYFQVISQQISTTEKKTRKEADSQNKNPNSNNTIVERTNRTKESNVSDVKSTNKLQVDINWMKEKITLSSIGIVFTVLCNTTPLSVFLGTEVILQQSVEYREVIILSCGLLHAILLPVVLLHRCPSYKKTVIILKNTLCCKEQDNNKDKTAPVVITSLEDINLEDNSSNWSDSFESYDSGNQGLSANGTISSASDRGHVSHISIPDITITESSDGSLTNSRNSTLNRKQEKNRSKNMSTFYIKSRSNLETPVTNSQTEELTASQVVIARSHSQRSSPASTKSPNITRSVSCVAQVDVSSRQCQNIAAVTDTTVKPKNDEGNDPGNLGVESQSDNYASIKRGNINRIGSKVDTNFMINILGLENDENLTHQSRASPDGSKSANDQTESYRCSDLTPDGGVIDSSGRTNAHESHQSVENDYLETSRHHDIGHEDTVQPLSSNQTVLGCVREDNSQVIVEEHVRLYRSNSYLSAVTNVAEQTTEREEKKVVKLYRHCKYVNEDYLASNVDTREPKIWQEKSSRRTTTEAVITNTSTQSSNPFLPGYVVPAETNSQDDPPPYDSLVQGTNTRVQANETGSSPQSTSSNPFLFYVEDAIRDAKQNTTQTKNNDQLLPVILEHGTAQEANEKSLNTNNPYRTKSVSGQADLSQQSGIANIDRSLSQSYPNTSSNNNTFDDQINTDTHRTATVALSILDLLKSKGSTGQQLQDGETLDLTINGLSKEYLETNYGQESYI